MKLIKPSYEIWEQDIPTKKLDDDTYTYRPKVLEEIFKHIERAGRVCYKSENRSTDTSSQPFVESLIKSQHFAMLEHGTVYLRIKAKNSDYNPILYRYCGNNYSIVKECLKEAYITTNYRVIIENHWEEDLKYLCEPTDYHEKRVTVHFVCNRQVSHEFVRHKLLCAA